MLLMNFGEEGGLSCVAKEMLTQLDMLKMC